MQTRDFYLRLRDPSGKRKDVINHHLVWDSDRFIEAQKQQYQGANTKPEDVRVVFISTREDYFAYRRGELK